MRNTIHSILLIVFAAMMAACSNDDYVGVVPDNCTALLSIDVPKLGEKQKGIDARLLRTFFRVSSPDGCGIDLASKLYLFQTPDGNTGLAARVKDADEVASWIEKLRQQGQCKRLTQHKDKSFTVIDGSWVAGFDDRALLVMGPVVATDQPTMMRRMIKMLDETSTIQDSQLFSRLEQMDAPMAFVAQSVALPEQLAPLCSLGAPEGTPPGKVMLAATITEQNRCMIVRGEPFSFDDTVDKALKKALDSYRVMKGSCAAAVPSTAVYTIMTNVNGQQFVSLLRGNKQLAGMLAGAGTKVDVETFIGNVDGDMVFSFSPSQGNMDNMRMQWAADIRKDPQPLDAESQQWADANRLLAPAADNNAAPRMPSEVLQAVNKARMATIINLASLAGKEGEGSGKSLLPVNIFSNIDYVIYITQ